MPYDSSMLKGTPPGVSSLMDALDRIRGIITNDGKNPDEPMALAILYRLSILALKIYHMKEQVERPEASAEHKAKLKVNNHNRHYEAYMPFAIAALIVMLIDTLLRITWFKRL